MNISSLYRDGKEGCLQFGSPTFEHGHRVVAFKKIADRGEPSRCCFPWLAEITRFLGLSDPYASFATAADYEDDSPTYYTPRAQLTGHHSNP